MNSIKEQVNYFDISQELDYEQILSNPILDIAARFWESERYEAFKICYKSMRMIDDLVDNRKAGISLISASERQKLAAKINDWLKAIDDWIPINSEQMRLIETLTKFQIPLWPWQNLSKAMIYDLKHDGFDTFATFLHYAEGAAVAPGSIFMHLCGVSEENGQYQRPLFNIRKAARPLAIFCYIVHIVRDFQKDQLANLNYFALNLLAENDLDVKKLKEMAEKANVTPNFRNLIKKYRSFGDYYRQKAREELDKITFYLKPRYKLSLEIIYDLYLQIFERIDIKNSTFTTEELNPTPKEIKKRIEAVVSSLKQDVEA